MDEIRPQEGPQEIFLGSSADIAFMGGAAGGGKTFAMLLEPTRHISTVDGFGAVFFRRTTKQIKSEGGAWDESKSIYPYLNGRDRESPDADWHFPPYDNRISFRHMEYEKNKLDWKGAQIPLIIFDQLEDFTRGMFFYMLSRNRSACGVRPYVRASYNPVPADDETGGWIHEFVGWYLDENGEYPDPEKAGVVRWFVNISNELHWFDSEEEARAEFPDIPPKSFSFIPSSVYDNKKLLEKDPGYLANLFALDHIDQERLLRSNHKIRPSAGKVFNKAWFNIIENIPPALDMVVRFWDFAATERKMAKGAATASVKMAVKNGRFIVLDVTEDWLGPGEIDGHVLSIARQDGREVRIRWEEEGGSSGKKVSYELTKLLAGYDGVGVRPKGDKLARGRPLAAQAYGGNVDVLRDAWTDKFLNHMHAIPDGDRWDIHDAASGAFEELTNPTDQPKMRQARVHKGQSGRHRRTAVRRSG